MAAAGIAVEEEEVQNQIAAIEEAYWKEQMKTVPKSSVEETGYHRPIDAESLWKCLNQSEPGGSCELQQARLEV